MKVMKKFSQIVLSLALILSSFSCDKLWNENALRLSIEPVKLVEGEDVLDITPIYEIGKSDFVVGVNVDANTAIISRDSICEVACKFGTTNRLFTEVPFELKGKCTDTLRWNINVKYMKNDTINESAYSGKYYVSEDVEFIY